MGKDRFEIVEVDGVVIYDESDDYYPGEERSGNGLCELEGNEDLDMEYILSTEQKRNAEMRRKKRIDSLISGAVVASVVLYIALLCWVFF